MKKFFVLFLLALSVVTVACQDQNSDLDQQQLESIAKNVHFKTYLAAMRDVQLAIARGDFALKAIIPVVMKNPSKSICEIPKEDFLGIYGGNLYQELSCKFEKSISTLKQELPQFSKLNEGQIGKVSKIHDKIEGINWAQELAKASSNKN